MNTIKSEIKLTKHIWRLTKNGKLKWKLNEVNHYVASYKGLVVEVEFFNFARMDEQSSDDSCGTAFLTISTNRLGFDFSVGTKQFTNLRRAVTFNKKEWKERKKRIAKRYTTALKYCKKI